LLLVEVLLPNENSFAVNNDDDDDNDNNNNSNNNELESRPVCIPPVDLVWEKLQAWSKLTSAEDKI